MSFPFRVAATLICAVVGLSCQCAFAAISLRLGVDTHNTSTGPDAKKPPDGKELFDVILDADYIAIRSPLETSVLDFKERRRIVVDNRTKTYVVYSLYDTVGFRAMEFQNREMMGRALASARIDGVSMPSLDNAHVLSIAPATAATLDETVEKDNVVFSVAGHRLANWRKDGIDVSPVDADRFAMFLRYRIGGHPKILHKLADGRHIPSEATFIFSEIWGKRTCVVSIMDIKHIDSTPYDLSPYSMRPGHTPIERIDDILDKAAGQGRTAMEVAKSANRESVATSFKDGHVLDALLGSMEWSLMTGEPMPPFSPEQAALVGNDPAVQRLVVALRAKSQDEFAAAVNTFVELRSQAPAKTYVLKLLEANDRFHLNDHNIALQLFSDVLQANPVLAGAYKDLGDVFLTQYDTARAWRCWDIGRQLAPRFANFSAVTLFEKSLVNQHPEYF